MESEEVNKACDRSVKRTDTWVHLQLRCKGMNVEHVLGKTNHEVCLVLAELKAITYVILRLNRMVGKVHKFVSRKNKKTKKICNKYPSLFYWKTVSRIKRIPKTI